MTCRCAGLEIVNNSMSHPEMMFEYSIVTICDCQGSLSRKSCSTMLFTLATIMQSQCWALGVLAFPAKNNWPLLTSFQVSQILFTVTARTSTRPPKGGSMSRTTCSPGAWQRKSRRTFSPSGRSKKKWLNMLYQQNCDGGKNWAWGTQKQKAVIHNFMLYVAVRITTVIPTTK